MFLSLSCHLLVRNRLVSQSPPPLKPPQIPASSRVAYFFIILSVLVAGHEACHLWLDDRRYLFSYFVLIHGASHASSVIPIVRST